MGGVKVGTGISVDIDGTITIPTYDLTGYALKTDIPYTLPASDVYSWAKASSKPIYTKNEVGLSNVDNTSDLDKPISYAISSALENKVDKIEGKSLSTNDYTTSEKDKLANIPVDTAARISSIENELLNYINWVGTYDANTDYVKYNIVGKEGRSYMCIQNSIGIDVSNTTYWALLADKGADGEIYWNNFTEQEKEYILSQINLDSIGFTTIGGFYVADESGNVGMKYNQEGFDVALMSSHLIQLLNETLDIHGITMDNAVTSSGVNPVPSSAIYTALQALKSETLQHIVFSCIKTTAEDGFFIVDGAGNIGFEVNNTQIKPSALSFNIIE